MSLLKKKLNEITMYYTHIYDIKKSLSHKTSIYFASSAIWVYEVKTILIHILAVYTETCYKGY